MNRYAFRSPYVPFAWEINKESADFIKERGSGVNLDPVPKNDLDSIYENTYPRDRVSEGNLSFFDDEACLGDRFSEGNLCEIGQADVTRDRVLKLHTSENPENLPKSALREQVSNKTNDKFDENAKVVASWDRVSQGAMPKNAQTDNKKDDITDEISNKRDIIVTRDRVSAKNESEVSSIGILYELLINVCRAKKEPLSREIYLNITI